MKIQLLIAAKADYAEYLSSVLSAKYAGTFNVGVCSAEEKVNETLNQKEYDVALIESGWIGAQVIRNVKLPLALWSDDSVSSENSQGIIRIKKYQRISALVSDILEHFAGIAPGFLDEGGNRGNIIAVWSPAGGVGKTSVALACATRRVSDGNSVTYLDLEHFSGADAYFANEGKSITLLFERLASNADVIVKSIWRRDAGSGINYFNPPVNYDDINELTVEDITGIVNICARASDIVVVDLPCVCDRRTQAVFGLADTVMLVTDGSRTAAAKMNIFSSQHSIFDDIRHKTVPVINKGAKMAGTLFDKAISLPLVQAADPVSVYKTLSGNSFEI